MILDISLPGKSGYKILKEVKAIKPELPVLILSMHAEEHYANKMFQAGVSGYLTKDNASENIVKAIEFVKSGKKNIQKHCQLRNKSFGFLSLLFWFLR